VSHFDLPITKGNLETLDTLQNRSLYSKYKLIEVLPWAHTHTHTHIYMIWEFNLWTKVMWVNVNTLGTWWEHNWEFDMNNNSKRNWWELGGYARTYLETSKIPTPPPCSWIGIMLGRRKKFHNNKEAHLKQFFFCLKCGAKETEGNSRSSSANISEMDPFPFPFDSIVMTQHTYHSSVVSALEASAYCKLSTYLLTYFNGEKKARTQVCPR
jgi:hypothetical protein